MNDEEQTLPLCDNCLVATIRKTGRRPIEVAGALLLSAGFVATLAINFWGKDTGPADPDSDFETIRSGLENVGKALPDYGLDVMAVIAALIVAIAVSIGQNTQQLRRLEAENAATHRSDLSALGKIQAMSTSLGAELMIAGVCMILIMVLAIAALVAGGAGPDMFGITCLASAGWLAFQLGHVLTLHSATADARTAFDTALTRKMQGRVHDIDKSGRRPITIRTQRRNVETVGKNVETVGKGVLWPLLAWWGLYLGPIAWTVLWVWVPEPADTGEVFRSKQVAAIAAATAVGMVMQTIVSTVASSALTDDGASRSLSILGGGVVGFLPAIMCSAMIVFLVSNEGTVSRLPRAGNLPTLELVLALSGWQIFLIFLLSMGVAGNRPFRAAARRYIPPLEPTPVAERVKRVKRVKPVSWGWTVLTWTVLIVVGAGVPGVIAGCVAKDVDIGERVDIGMRTALTLGVMMVMTLWVAGHALLSEEKERRTAVVATIVLTVGGAAVAGLLLGSNQCWIGVVGGLYFVAVTGPACCCVVKQELGGTLSKPFIALQARREEPVRRLQDVGKNPPPAKGRCADPTCRNYRGDAGKTEGEGDETGDEESREERETGREEDRQKRKWVGTVVLIGMMLCSRRRTEEERRAAGVPEPTSVGSGTKEEPTG